MLRCPQEEDGPQVYAAVQESLVSLRRYSAFMPWANAEPSLAASTAFCVQAQQAFAQGRHRSYLVVDADTQRLAGMVGLHRISPQTATADLGFWCRASLQRQGYMLRAAQALIAHDMPVLGLSRLQAISDASNHASHSLCRALGFEYTGCLPHFQTDASGQARDAFVFVLQR